MGAEIDIPKGEGSSLPAGRVRRGSRYDAEASDHTIRPLSREQYARVLASAKVFTPSPGSFEGLTPWEIIEFLELTGMAPIVLCRPQKWNLRSAPDLPDGTLHVRFTRHKKKGISGETDLPVVTLDDPGARWIPAFIDRAVRRPFSLRTLHRVVSAVGRAAGIPLSARTLRHTCGVRIAKSGDIGLVCAWLNCSPVTAAHYLRIAGAHDPRFLALARGPPARPPGALSSPSAA